MTKKVTLNEPEVFKVGYKVRVRSDLVEGAFYVDCDNYDWLVLSGMAKMRGKVGVVEFADDDNTYLLSFDGVSSGYWWSHILLESVTENDKEEE